jgi:hypothetical protein
LSVQAKKCRQDLQAVKQANQSYERSIHRAECGRLEKIEWLSENKKKIKGNQTDIQHALSV